MSSETAVRVSHLGKCYQIYKNPRDRLLQALFRGRKQLYREFWALRDVSFEVKKGEIIGIIGCNGSGKSTLLQIIAKILTPTTGSVQVNGRTVALLELGTGFNPECTGRENILLNSLIFGITREEMQESFENIVAFSGIGEFVDQPVKTYSSGMVMRLAFAISVNVDPEVLLIDEALSVGDTAFQFKCIERLERLACSGTTLLFVSHNIGIVMAFCHQVIYLANGEINGAGSAKDIVDLYLLDSRERQRQFAGSPWTIHAKPSITGSGRLAFGTDQGSIVNAEFCDSEVHEAIFRKEDIVRIKIEVRLLDWLKNPSMSVIVNDYRMLPIMGRFFRLSKANFQNKKIHRVVVECSFKASLAAGEYFVTFRLEDRITDEQFVIVDKQTGALSFQVLKEPNTNFLGVVDVGMDFKEKVLD